MGARPRVHVLLVMIVKDEELILSERLRAVRGEIDGWCIVDTGSTDNTEAVVRNVLGKLPGNYSHVEWRGFGDARTLALARAETLAQELWKQDPAWALLLDADTVATFRPRWRDVLATGADVVEATVSHGALRYVHPRLLRLGSHPWRFRGVLHEYLEIPARSGLAHSDLIGIEHGHGGARSRDPEKYRRDAELLRSTREAMALHPDGTDSDLLPRYAFYEAQSWMDAGDHQRAIDGYVERAGMDGGFWEERYISWLRVGELRWAHQSHGAALQAFLRAWAVDPTRAEALIALATMAREELAWAPALMFARKAVELTAKAPAHGLFADVNVRWRALFEVSVAAWYCGERNTGASACEALLAEPGVPESVLERTRSNLALYGSAV